MKLQTFLTNLMALTFCANGLDAAAYTVSLTGDNCYGTFGCQDTPTSGDLRWCMNRPDATSITFNLAPVDTTITLENMLPLLGPVSSISIDGSNGGSPITINGDSKFPGFFAAFGDVSLSNMTIANTVSAGGHGGESNYGGLGGGGLGAGGGLFVNRADVTISNLHFEYNSAQGGTGAKVDSYDYNYGGGGGGGGMFYGRGGVPSYTNGGAGAGGGGMGGYGGRPQSYSYQSGGGVAVASRPKVRVAMQLMATDKTDKMAAF